jgi:O-antigen ligase
LVCIFGIYQFLGDSFGLSTHLTGLREAYTKSILGFPRIQSVGLEPLYFANFLMVPFFISVKRYINSERFFNNYFFVLILILINIILSISRGAYISLGFAFLILLAYLLIKKGTSGYKLKFFGILTALVVSLCLSLNLIFLLNGHSAQQNFVDHAVVENVQSDGSASDRIQTYNKAINLFKLNPVFGNGLGSFGVSVSPTEQSNSGYQTVNNEYLELLSETGVMGLGLFALFFLFLLFEIWNVFKKKNDSEKLSIIILILGCLAIFIQYNFFSTLYIIYIWVFLALLKGEANSEKK